MEGKLLGSSLIRSLIQKIHESSHSGPTGGHFGVAKTMDRLRTRFWHPGLAKKVKEFVRTCAHCQKFGRNTELYAFEVSVISYNKFSEGKNWENFKTIHVVCFSSAMLCIQMIICSITYDDDNWYTYSII